MKTLLTCIFAAAVLAPVLSAQAQTSVALQGKNIEVKYAAQSMSGRKIFGAAVPYGQVWRIGDKAAATLHTESDLAFYGMTVPKGDYTLYVDVKDPNNWVLVINKQTGQWGLTYTPAQDLGRVKLNMSKPPASIENLKYTLTSEGGNNGKLQLEWENHIASVSFTAK